MFKLYSLIYDPDGKMWILEFSLGVCSTKLRSLVSSLEYLVSNGRQVLLGDIGLDSSATPLAFGKGKASVVPRRWCRRHARN